MRIIWKPKTATDFPSFMRGKDGAGAGLKPGVTQSQFFDPCDSKNWVIVHIMQTVMFISVFVCRICVCAI